MKLQKLTIHNIASIEDAVIDFESQPLADSEVFLITGKTGAGKSTILDAICLALYADTPRLDSTKMKGDTKDGEKAVRIDDPRQLMRRNTGEAFVTLTFIGSNGVHYEAVWSVARARKKVTGNLQSKYWQLKNVDNGYIINKDREIEAEIKVAVGLDFSQFCRTTMLAQGEFTRFLNSRDDEKAEILEKITGVDVYSKIGAKVFEITSGKKQIFDEAMLLIQGTHTLSDEDINNYRNELHALDLQYNELKAATDKENGKLQWIRTDIELSGVLRDATEAYRQTLNVVESDDFKQKEGIIKDWFSTIDARRWAIGIKDAESVKKQQKEMLDSLAGEFAVMLGGGIYARSEVKKIDNGIKKIDAFLETEKDKAAVYENAQTIVGNLKIIAEGRIFVDKEKERHTLENRLLTDRLIPDYEKAEAAVKKVKAFCDKQEAEIEIQSEAVARLRISELRAQRDGFNDILNRISAASERLEIYASEKNRMDNMFRNLADRFSKIENLKKTLTGIDRHIHDAALKLAIRREDLEKQRDSIDKFAKTLRLKLQVGDICPVCRQKITSDIPCEDDLQILVNGLRELYDSAEKEHNELVDKKRRLDAEIAIEEESYDRDRKALEADQSVIVAENKALEACKICGIDLLDDTTSWRLAALLADVTEKRSALDIKIKSGETLEFNVRELHRSLIEKREELDRIKALAREAENAVNECKNRMRMSETMVDSKQAEIANAIDSTGRMVSGINWNIDWQEAPCEFASALTSASKVYADNILLRHELEVKHKEAIAVCGNVEEVMDSIVVLMPVWRHVEPQKIERLFIRTRDLNTAVNMALTHIGAADDIIVTNRNKIDDFLLKSGITFARLEELGGISSDNIEAMRESLDRVRKNVVAKKALFESCRKQYDGHRQKKPEFSGHDETGLLEARITELEKRLSAIVERKGAVIQELKTDAENRERLSALIKDADNKKSDYHRWLRLNQLIGDSTGNKFRKIAQSYVLTSLIHSANSYLKTLTDRYTLKVVPGTFVISLEDAYQGFVCRAASTVSGGESFLISLSLALALSDIGSQLSVDTLFIDEGFGTLSGEPLQNAVNTLRSLHSKTGRHVGIISHVEELRERIPVQIQVNQEGNNSSSEIRVVSL